MQVAVIGPLEVRSEEGVPLAVPGARERLLLAALVAGAPGVVSTDRLIDIVWSGSAPETARKSLHVHLAHLRNALAPDRPTGSSGQYVVRRGSGYVLGLDRSAIDTLRFTDLVTRGQAQLAAGDATAAVQLLSSALALWRGEPYSDWPEEPFAEAERRRLTAVREGAETVLLDTEIGRGRHVEVLPELERLIAEGPLREDLWRLLMLALYRGGRQADALAAGRRVRSLLADQLGSSPGPALREMEAAILAQDPSLAPPRQRPSALATGTLAPGACPFKGLAAYQVADAPLFHGRRRAVTALIGRLVDCSVVAVTGPSGAGKSSLVRAGLIPALATGVLPTSDEWRATVITPGVRPVAAIAAVADAGAAGDRVLLVVDQFEELWAPGIDQADRAGFLARVLRLLDEGSVIRCVLVMRGDHVGRLADDAAFAERLDRGVLLVPALTDAELREIVTESARTVGLRVDPDLLDTVIDDVVGRTGALPMLSTALVGTWERRRDDVLTLAGYLEVGGVAGALTRTAEAAYAELDEAEQVVARRILVRLADTDAAGAVVRRSVPLAELDLGDATSSGQRAVVDAFVRRRLLAVDGERLEAAHEALLTAWPRLARWLEDDAAGRAVRRHLAPAAREWAQNGRAGEELYRGARLAAALDWAAGPDADVTSVERDFLAASGARAEAELNEERARTRREVVARRRTRRLAVGLAVILVVALVATVLAVRSEQAVRRGALTAEANRLAAVSRTVTEIDLAMLLAAQAFRLADTPETRDGLRATVAAHRRAVAVLPVSPQARNAQLGDGRTLFVTVSNDLYVWPIASSTGRRSTREMPSAWALSETADASPTQAVVAAVGSVPDPWLLVADADRPEQEWLDEADLGGDPVDLGFTRDGGLLNVVVDLPAGPDGRSRWQVLHVDPTTLHRRAPAIVGEFPVAAGVSADISDDGLTAVVWSDARLVPPVIVDLDSGQQTPLSADANGDFRIGPEVVVGYRALASGVAQLGSHGSVTFYDRTGAARQQIDVHDLELQQGPVRDVVLSPDGSWGAMVGSGATVQLFDVDPVSDFWTRSDTLTGHLGDVSEAEIDPASELLVTIGWGDRMVVWNARPDVEDITRLDPATWLRTVCAVVERDLTKAEWNRYLPDRPWQATCTDLD